MVPNGWDKKTLNDVSKITRLAGAEYSDVWETDINGEIIALRGFNIGNNEVNLRDVERISQDMSLKLSRSKLYKNDIVFPCVGSIGKAYLVQEDDKFHINQNIAKITPHDDVEPLFLTYCLLSKPSVNQILKFNTSSSQPNVLVGNLRKFKFAFPQDRREQRKIAKILSTWDKAIATTEKLIESSKQQKKALMQQLLTGKKRLVNPETGKVFEGEWEVHTFENYFDIGSSKRVLQSEWKDEGVPFYRTRELVSLAKREAFRSEIFISKELFDSLKEKYGIPTNGDLLVSGVGTLGISYLVGADDKFYFKDGNVLWFKNLGNIDSKFFDYCFHSDFVKNQILNQATITTVGTYTITNAKKTKFKCPLDKQEQQKIASVLTAADKEIEVLEAKLAHFKQEKKALMQQLLTGKRRVKVEAMEMA